MDIVLPNSNGTTTPLDKLLLTDVAPDMFLRTTELMMK